MKKILFNLIISVCIISGSFLSGCGGPDTTTQETGEPTGSNTPPECVTTNYVWNIEYDYMVDGLGNRNAVFNREIHFYAAFLYKIGLHLSLLPSNGDTSQFQILNTSPGDQEKVAYVLNQYRHAHYNINYDTLRGYIVGIDSVTMTSWSPDVVGYSNCPLVPIGDSVYSRASMVFVGKIRRLRPSDWWDYAEAIGTHEIGHQIVIAGHGGHGGRDSAYCIMNEVTGPNEIGTFAFCDTHCCQIFRTFPLPNPSLPNRNLPSFASFPSLTIQNTSSNFQLEISSNKDVYYEGEPVFVTVKAKNLRSAIDSLPNFNEAGISENLNVLDPSGKKLPHLFVPPSYIGKLPSTRFLPGEEINVDILINAGFGNVFQRGGLCNPSHYFGLGKYTVQSLFRDYKENKLSSNIISFEIISPEGEEKYALENMRKIFKMPDGTFNEKKKKFDAYRDFFYKDTGNVYVEYIFRYMLWLYLDDYLYKTVNKDTILNDVRYFISKYPNSMFAGWVLIMGTDAFDIFNKGSNPEIRSFLNEIISKYPNTRASNEAEKLRKKYFGN